MKKLRDVLEKIPRQDITNHFIMPERLDQAEAEIKKIVLDMVGEDKEDVDFESNITRDQKRGYNQAKAEIRTKLKEV